MTTERTPERAAEDRELIEKAIRDYVTFEYHAIGSKKSVQRVQDALRPLSVPEPRTEQVGDYFVRAADDFFESRQVFARSGDVKWKSAGSFVTVPNNFASVAALASLLPLEIRKGLVPEIVAQVIHAANFTPCADCDRPNICKIVKPGTTPCAAAPVPLRQEDWVVPASHDGAWYSRRINVKTGVLEVNWNPGEWSAEVEPLKNAKWWARGEVKDPYVTAVADMLDRWSARDHRSGRTPTAEQCWKEKP